MVINFIIIYSLINIEKMNHMLNIKMLFFAFTKKVYYIHVYIKYLKKMIIRSIQMNLLYNKKYLKKSL
jgi:hypothetical protein